MENTAVVDLVQLFVDLRIKTTTLECRKKSGLSNGFGLSAKRELVCSVSKTYEVY